MVIEFLDKHLIDDWRFKVKHLWTLRIALFWIVVSAVAGIWTALEGVIPTNVYIIVGFLMNLSLGVARLLKQTGVDE